MISSPGDFLILGVGPVDTSYDFLFEKWLKSHQSRWREGTSLACHDELKFGNLLKILILHRALLLLLNNFVKAEHAKSIKHLQYLQKYVTTVASNMYLY